jgi:uncharacterized CHY-type Zn-finger protein
VDPDRWGPVLEADLRTKVCRVCGCEKSVDDFYRNNSYKSGYANLCKACHNAQTTARHVVARAADPSYHTKRSSVWRHANPDKVRLSHLRRVYGITAEQYETMVLVQENACALCHVAFTKTPLVDHDHITGRIRGLLCAGCNNILGLARDSAERLRAAADYLERGR